MEEVISLYTEEGDPDPARPYVCFDETSKQLVEAKYQKQLGKQQRSLCPSYMDAAYFDRFAANWKHIAPQLGLESLMRSTGHPMQMAVSGPDGKGTILVDVFNEHQRQVYSAMTSKKPMLVPDFDSLKADVVKGARLNESPSPVASLTADQQEAVQPANQIRAGFLKIFSALDAGLSATDADKVKTVLLGIIDDVGRMAESEMELGIVNDSLSGPRAPQLSYNAASETRLNADEQKTFAGFMKKPRFTRADFPALEKFYSGPYDKLTERGKDEMSKRIDAGMRPAP